MKKPPMPTYACPDVEDESAMLANAEKMLDVADVAGVDLRALEMYRRKLAREMTEYDALPRHGGASARRAQELERSIGRGVTLLAGAFEHLASMVKNGVAHAKPS
jgi:hypothetical protein